METVHVLGKRSKVWHGSEVEHKAVRWIVIRLREQTVKRRSCVVDAWAKAKYTDYTFGETVLVVAVSTKKELRLLSSRTSSAKPKIIKLVTVVQ